MSVFHRIDTKSCFDRMPTSHHHHLLSEQLALADSLLAGRETMRDPQDLPGRYGRVVQAIDRVLEALDVTVDKSSISGTSRHYSNVLVVLRGGKVIAI